MNCKKYEKFKEDLNNLKSEYIINSGFKNGDKVILTFQNEETCVVWISSIKVNINFDDNSKTCLGLIFNFKKYKEDGSRSEEVLVGSESKEIVKIEVII